MLAAEQTKRIATDHKSTPAQKSKENRSTGWATTVFYLLITAFMLQGWRLREQHLISAEEGIGYLLGIAGGTLMLLLLLYPLRKKSKALRFLGPLKHIFRLHMIFGVLGPTLILFHANFRLGAFNSNIALWSMLVVAASGLIGRYIYSRLHNGLYGHRLTLRELQNESHWRMGNIVHAPEYFPEIEKSLVAFEKSATNAAQGIFCPVKIPFLGIRSLLTHRTLLIKYRKKLRRGIQDPKMQRMIELRTNINLRKYFRSARRVATYGFYCRLFSLWHILHLPLFIMMLVTGIIHIIAVHMY